MAYLLLLHEKLRLQRKVNKLTLRQASLSNRKERIAKNIERVQKLYSKRMTSLEQQAKTAQNQFSSWVRMSSGLGSMGLNPMNFGAAGGMSMLMQSALGSLVENGTITQDALRAVMTGGAKKNDNGEWVLPDNTTISADDYQKASSAIWQAQQLQSARQMQVQSMSAQYETNVSVWLEAEKEQLEAEQDEALMALEAEQTDIETETTSIDMQLADAKARLESVSQACSEGIKSSAPTFGLG